MEAPSEIGVSTGTIPALTPHINMEFESLDNAWNFWVSYGGQMGFHVRKRYANENSDGVVTSGGFVCGNAGHRGKDNRDRVIKKSRAETRTDCPVVLRLKLVKKTGKYVVSDFVAEHNHDLQGPEAIHLIPSQRNISQHQATTIDTADDAGLRPKEAYELMAQEVGGAANVGLSRRDHYNYLRDKRYKSLACGEAASIMRYFYKKTLENASFYHTEDVDDYGQISNIFWADAKMLVDYALFGDVITFDTTYSTNKEYRPFGVFVGFNNFREIVVFGAVLLYEESAESFKWVFETFLAAHKNKYPKTIFTDQDPAMAKALEKVMPDTVHGLCTWHIGQNAIKNLVSKRNRKGSKKVKGNEVLKIFKACMYDFEDENEFEEAFKSMKQMICAENEVAEENNSGVEEISGNGDEYEESTINGKKNGGKRRKSDGVSWLDFIYSDKEKWAQCYMKNTFTLGMRSTQLSESFNKDMKAYLKSNLDVVRFFHHFERVLIQKRQREIDSVYEMRKKQPILKAKVPILQQASSIYTPKIFEIFQSEWEVSMASSVKSRIEGQLSTEYQISVTRFDNGCHTIHCFLVIFSHVDQSISCSCNKFGRMGVLCGHALKLLDVMDMKLLPEKYIMQRWSRAARNQTVQDESGRVIVENPKLAANHRYQAICRKLLPIAERAANFEEASVLLCNISELLSQQVEETIQNLTSVSKDGGTAHPATALSPASNVDNLMEMPTHSALTLKKKERKRKSGKRPHSWVEDLSKRQNGSSNKKGQKNLQGASNFEVSKSCKGVDVTKPITGLDCMKWPKEQYHGCQPSFTELLRGAPVIDFSQFSYPTEVGPFSQDTNTAWITQELASNYDESKG